MDNLDEEKESRGTKPLQIWQVSRQRLRIRSRRVTHDSVLDDRWSIILNGCQVMKRFRIKRHATSTSTFLDIGIYWKMLGYTHRSRHTCIWYVCPMPILWNFTSKTIYTHPHTSDAPTMLTNPKLWQMCLWRGGIEPSLQGRPISSPVPAVLCGSREDRAWGLDSGRVEFERGG